MAAEGVGGELFMTKGFGATKKPTKKAGSQKEVVVKRSSSNTGFDFTGPLRPGVQSARRSVSSGVVCGGDQLPSIPWILYRDVGHQGTRETLKADFGGSSRFYKLSRLEFR